MQTVAVSAVWGLEQAYSGLESVATAVGSQQLFDTVHISAQALALISNRELAQANAAAIESSERIFNSVFDLIG
jgi:hypothetical protein